MKAVVIGKGNIGKKLLEKLGTSVKYVVDVDGIFSGDEKVGSMEELDVIADVDVVFLAIPTFKGGEIAKKYMQYFIPKNIPVVTCEKGALGHCFACAESHLDMVGKSATVGGGTQMLKYLEDMKNENIKGVYGIVNGTMNFIADELSKGNTLHVAVNDAIEAGYTEPGATIPIDVFRAESLSDVPLKAVIIANVCGLGPLSFDELKVKDLTDEDVKTISEGKYRLVVAISREVQEGIALVEHDLGSWNLYVGFIEEEKLPFDCLPSGVNNAMLVDLGADGKYTIIGPGAGPDATAAAMVRDAKRLLIK